MATTRLSKLNALQAHLAPRTPLTPEDLVGVGISPDLAVHYVRVGWLTHGVFHRSIDELTLNASLSLLERRLEGLQVGGTSALKGHGLRQYMSQPSLIHLYGWAAGRLPEWFVERLSAEYHRKRLFDERPDALVHVYPFERRKGAHQVSTPERALLELLSYVGVRQRSQEAHEFAKDTHNLRLDVLRVHLQCCKSVRLYLHLGRERALLWAAKLAPVVLPTGSDRPWVSKSNDGLLVLKP